MRKEITHHVYLRIHTVHFGEYAERKHNLCYFVNFCLQEYVHEAPLNPLDAYLSLSVDGICPSVPAAHLLMPDTQWPVIAALCSLLSSLLLDAVEECAGHSFPLPCCLGSCQLKSRLPFVCGCRTATPAASTCRTSLLTFVRPKSLGVCGTASSVWWKHIQLKPCWVK